MGEDRPALDVRRPPEAADLDPLLDALLDDYQPFAVEPLDAATRRVHFFRGRDRLAALEAVASRFGARGVTVVAVSVPDENWAERSQAALRAVRVGRVVVTPPWDHPDVDPHDTLVVIRPSMGFGTGHHASTRLCLHALQAQSIEGHTVLDVGTGSGVLGITAAKLGAAAVVAIDNDPDAVATARENVGLNDLDGRIDVRHADFRRVDQLGDASIVLANLSAAVVCDSLERLVRLVSRPGTLIVGGVLASEELALRRALEPIGHVAAVHAEDEWVAVVLEVGASSP